MRLHVRDVGAPRGADRPLRALRADDDVDHPVLARRRAWRSLTAVPDPDLPDPFRWEGEHVTAELPGARVLFSTRRGGVSAGPFASLNLGRLTADDGANVDANRERLAAAVGLPRERFLYGRQVHGADVRRATEPPGAGRPAAEEDGQATALGDARRARLRRRLPAGAARRRGRRRRAALRLARAAQAGSSPRASRALRELGADGRDRGRDRPGRARLLLRGRRGGPRGVRRRPGRARGRAQPRPAGRSHATRLAQAGVGTVHDTGLCTMCDRASSSRTGATAASPAARRGSCGGRRPGSRPRANARPGARGDRRRRAPRRPRRPATSSC